MSEYPIPDCPECGIALTFLCRLPDSEHDPPFADILHCWQCGIEFEEFLTKPGVLYPLTVIG